MSSTLDRQIRPIYDALETGSNKSAVLACNKVLKKQPNNVLVKALKALALVKLQKVEESLVLCDEVLASKPVDDGVLTAMMHVLRGLGRHNDMIAMFENAYKQQPTSEELGQQTFLANVRVGNWKSAQQIATKMNKQLREDRFLYWSVFSTLLQANDPSTPPELQPVLLKLAQRLIETTSVPSYSSPDRLYVHILVLRELKLYDEALALLTTEIGQAICETSLVCEELRRDLIHLKGLIKEEGDRAEQRIVEKKDRNWLEFISLLDAALWDVTSVPEPSDEAKAAAKERIKHTQEVLAKVAEEDGLKDRSAALASLDLEKRARAQDVSTDPSLARTLAENYFSKFSSKACCYEDLQPYVLFEGDELAKWTSFLESQRSFETLADLQRGINVLKLLRWNLTTDELTPELELARAKDYVKEYLAALPFGKSLPDTELQPADDLALLAGETYVNLWKLTNDQSHLFSAASILEYASARSKQSYRIRLLLIRIYHLLGAPSLALEHYRLMNVKQVQTDTLSHLVLTRAATFSLSALGDITYLSECMDSSQIYMSNSQETSEFISRAFQMEKYSQIEDIIVFEDRLDNSLQRDLMKIEHVRMRLAHEQINADLVDMELIELKFIFDRLHHDNRDFSIIPNYQPHSIPSFNEQTLPFGKIPGIGWLTVFLKIYIKAFQLASDLVESVEDKLLIGDRPKPSNDPENKIPLNERLAKKKEEEMEELTPDELAFYEFASALSEWLAPYHDYARPPPSALLAEAAKQNELKPGHPLRNITPPPDATNGSSKKDEEPPTVKEAPEVVSKFFEEMRTRFKAVAEGSQEPTELLHLATLTQEAFLVFTIETVRFKPASVIKQNKLNGLTPAFKEVRTKAVEVLTEISNELIKIAEQSATREKRDAFIAASKDVQAESGFDHDFVLGVARKTTDAKKHVLEGVGKGIQKVLKNHA
ncbi:MDM20/NAA25 family protein [Abortiporus biennis]